MSENNTQVQVAQTVIAPKQASVLATMASRLSIEPKKLMDVLKKTAFATCRNDEEFISMCVVANKYGLDPITKEIYAFPNKGGAVVPIVGYDGWVKMCNSNPQFDGVEFEEAPDGSWCECRIYRKDRSHPTTVREWFDECNMKTMPWMKFPRRMLRNKTFNQCARMAFGFAGIYDPDEAERIVACQNQEAQRMAEIATGSAPQPGAKPVKTRPLGQRRATSAELMAKSAQKPAVNAERDVINADYTETEGTPQIGDFEQDTARQELSTTELIDAGVL